MNNKTPSDTMKHIKVSNQKVNGQNLLSSCSSFFRQASSKCLTGGFHTKQQHNSYTYQCTIQSLFHSF